MRRAAWLAASFLVGLAGCSADETLETTPVSRGRAVFESPGTSRNSLNTFSCATCHVTAGSAGKRAGGTLAGATARPTFWGGKERDLLEASNRCMSGFMLDPVGLDREDQRARDLFAFLSAQPGPAAEVPFTIQGDVVDVPRGDATRGAATYDAACLACHGARVTGVGALARVPKLPGDTVIGHPGYTPLQLRLQVLEKIRHGPYFGYGGTMPPFSHEVLSDEDVGDVLEALDFIGE